MKSKVLVKLVVVLIVSAIILLLGTNRLPAGDYDLGDGYGLYSGRSNSSVYEAYADRVKFDKFNPTPLSSPALGLIPFFW